MPEEATKARRKGLKGLLDRARASVAMSPRRRRLLLRLGIAGLVLTAIVIVPGYLAAQPTFLGRYANMEAEYETWETSVHAKVACQRCHNSPELLSRARYNARMLGEFYVSQVLRNREPDLLGTPPNDACLSCHADLRTVSPSGDLNIPHSAHVDILELDCIACHIFLVHEESPEGKHTPRMVDCLTCHDGKQAKNACTTCHTEKAAPENHGSPDWAIVHASKQSEVDCASCHDWTENWCAECHSRRPNSHIEKWRSQHRFQVEKRRNCEACHVADFCIVCHGEVPALNFDPALKLVE